MRGYEYWKSTFFLSDGTPKYYNHKILPLDIQCCSQAIDTLVFFSDRDPESRAARDKGRADGRSRTCRTVAVTFTIAAILLGW